MSSKGSMEKAVEEKRRSSNSNLILVELCWRRTTCRVLFHQVDGKAIVTLAVLLDVVQQLFHEVYGKMLSFKRRGRSLMALLGPEHEEVTL